MAGSGIGVVAALMGVAGGELLVPTIVLLSGADVTAADSLSLAVPLPTTVVASTRHSRGGRSMRCGGTRGSSSRRPPGRSPGR